MQKKPEGHRAIEALEPGEHVLSRNEADPQGAVEPKVVEEVFVRFGRVLHLRLQDGVVLRTTGEHPFFPIRTMAWTPARELREGDALLGRRGELVNVEGVEDTGEYETVYNLSVADFHTYFVGCDEWGWGVWAHNEYPEFLRKLGVADSEELRDIYKAMRGTGGNTREEAATFVAMMVGRFGASPAAAGDAWRQLKLDRAALAALGGRDFGELPEDAGDPLTLAARNKAAARAYLEYVIEQRGEIEPLVGGGGRNKLYLILKEGDGANALKDGRDYIGTTFRTILERMRGTDHTKKTENGAPPTARQIARALKDDQSVGLETILVAQGGMLLGNIDPVRSPTHVDYPRVVAAGFALLRGWHQWFLKQ